MSGSFPNLNENMMKLEIKSEKVDTSPANLTIKQEHKDVKLKLEVKSDEEIPLDEEDKGSIDPDYKPAKLIVKKEITENNETIFGITATVEQSPNIAVNEFNSCSVYHLGNNQLAKLANFNSHTKYITDLKFSNENPNLLYTSSVDGTVKLWDLRTQENTLTFSETTEDVKTTKVLNSFDISSNGRVLAAGSNLVSTDAFILFWDTRNANLLGGYWESHTDDITQVKFHKTDSNKLMSGSTDGLINIYDLSESNEDDALRDTLNTESSVEKLEWLEFQNKDIIGCITHTVDVQFWKLEDAQPYLHVHRSELASSLKGIEEDYIYVTNLHQGSSQPVLLAGSSYLKSECFRALSAGKICKGSFDFRGINQAVRGSFFNQHTNLLITGGEKGEISAWNLE